MGQKIDPRGLRLGIVRDWDAKWYADKKNFSVLLLEDVKMRNYIKNKLYVAGISRINIERTANRVRIGIYAAKPGIVIGRGGSEVEALRKELVKQTGKQISINIIEVKKTELDAQLVSESIAGQLARRMSFRRAMKQAVGRAMKLGAEGIRVAVKGRLGGAEIARSEWYSEGKVPLHTLRANIDYGVAEARTTFGRIGVKVWIYKERFCRSGLVKEASNNVDAEES